MARNIAVAFTRRALRNSRQTAIQLYQDGRWVDIKYGELHKDIAALSYALRSHYGIREGERVAFGVGNRPEWPIVFFAILHAGAVAVPVNSQGSPAEIGNILAESGSRMIFTEADGPSFSIGTVSVDSDDFKRLISSVPAEEYVSGAKRDDTACIMYTSGTTSRPKGVMLSHGNLLSNMYSLYNLGFMKSGDGIVSVLPLYHAYAMVVTTVGPLVYSGRVVYPGSIRSKEVMAALRESDASIFIGVPLIFEAFHKTLKESLGLMPAFLRRLIESVADASYFIRRHTDLNLARYIFYPVHASVSKAIRVYMCGGAKLNEKVEADLFKFGFTVLNGYGLTETSPVLTVNPEKNPKVGSVGLPLKNVEIKVADADENGIGEICARGSNIMKGYYNNDALTREAVVDGWFRTKDIGYIDKDGYLFLVGRKDDAITLGTGLSMCPDELEEAYLAAAPVKEICIFEAPHPKDVNNAPAIWAVVVPKMEIFGKKGIVDPYYYIKMSLENVSRVLSIPERLMGFYVTVDELPRTLMGKLKRGEVKRRYLAGQIREAFGRTRKRLTDKGLSALQGSMAGRVIECLKAQARVDDVSPDDSFELDLGIDLAGRAELAFGLEKALNLKISEDEINKVFTVGELIAHVENITP